MTTDDFGDTMQGKWAAARGMVTSHCHVWDGRESSVKRCHARAADLVANGPTERYGTPSVTGVNVTYHRPRTNVLAPKMTPPCGSTIRGQCRMGQHIPQPSCKLQCVEHRVSEL